MSYRSTNGKDTAAKLRAGAESIMQGVEERLEPLRQAPTRKRIDEYYHQYKKALMAKRKASAMIGMAQAFEAGTLPAELVGVTSMAAIHELFDFDHQYNTTSLPKPLLALYSWSDIQTAAKHMSVYDDAWYAQKVKLVEAECKCYRGIGSIPDFFPTQDEIIRILLGYSRAGCDQNEILLEPQAGMGNIWRMLAEMYPGNEIRLIERQYTLREYLQLLGAPLLECEDFLKYQEKVDHIVMNPPFSKGADVVHVKHAWSLLKPGGSLVSVMSNSWQHQDRGVYKGFKDWLEKRGAYWEKLPDGAFKDSGTNTNTVFVVLYNNDEEPQSEPEPPPITMVEDAPPPVISQAPPLEPQPVAIAAGVTVTQHGDPAVELAAKEQTAARNGSGITGAVGSEIRYEGYRLKAVPVFGVSHKCAAFYAPSNIQLAVFENLPANQWEAKIVELVQRHQAGGLQSKPVEPPAPSLNQAPTIPALPGRQEILKKLNVKDRALAQQLVPEIVTWLRTYKDRYGRTWRLIDDVAAHSSSTHYHDITAEWRKRKIAFTEPALKAAIKIAILALKAETQPPAMSARLQETIEIDAEEL